MSYSFTQLQQILPANLDELAARGYAFDTHLNRDPLWDYGPCDATAAQRAFVARQPWALRAQWAFEYIVQISNIIIEDTGSLPNEHNQYSVSMFGYVAQKANDVDLKELPRIMERAIKHVDARMSRINDLRMTLYGADAMHNIALAR